MYGGERARERHAYRDVVSSPLRGLLALLFIGALFAGIVPSVAEAKTPGTVHCYGGWCHRIHSVEEMDAMVGRRGIVKASYYDDCRRDRFNPCGLTSSGAVFRPHMPDNAASPVFPDGTILLIYNPESRLSAVVRVTSAGPYRGDRTLDVSRATAQQIGFIKQGIATVEVAVLKSPEPHEARYRRLRTYPTVPGFLGRFPTFDDAHDVALTRLQMIADHVSAVVTAGYEIDSYWPKGLAIEVSTTSFDGDTLSDAGPSDHLHLAGNILGPVIIASAADGVADFAGRREALSETADAMTAAETAIAFVPGLSGVLSNVLAVAREKARLSRSDAAGWLSALLASREAFFSGIKAFIRSAQARARVGAADRDGPAFFTMAR